jgi:3-deoxy-manno-octulosonate cytidylyltransferase (CMP-KDO synthetase)
MKIKVVIPCHLDSLRLKRKILIDIHGLPMIEHVRRRALLCKKVDEVIIATGDIEIKEEIEKYGGSVIFTDKNHLNGTSRVNEAISKIDCTHVVLVQGDEPLLIPKYLDEFINSITRSKGGVMWNAVSDFKKNHDTYDENKVKCLLDYNNKIIFCFRKNPITNLNSNYYKLIYKIQGLIAFEKSTLKKVVESNLSGYGLLESIEQMKAIEFGIKINAVKLPSSLPSVNDKDELEVVKKILLEDKQQINLFKKINNEFYK